jgi:hypothetical protein
MDARGGSTMTPNALGHILFRTFLFIGRNAEVVGAPALGGKPAVQIHAQGAFSEFEVQRITEPTASSSSALATR